MQKVSLSGIVFLAVISAVSWAQNIEETAQLPLWAIYDVSPLEISTGGLGSIFVDDPSYLLWKPSLISLMRSSRFSINHMRSRIPGNGLKRTDFFGYGWATTRWIVSLGALNRNIQGGLTPPILASTSSENLLALSLNRIFTGFDENSGLSVSSGLTARGLLEHYSPIDSTSGGISLDLNTLISVYGYFSLGIDFYGLGSKWDRIGVENSDSSDAEGDEYDLKWAGYHSQILHLGAYISVPVPSIKPLDKNIALSWGVLAREGENPKYAYGASGLISLEELLPEKNLLSPASLCLHTGYSELGGWGYGLTLSYHDISITYSRAEDSPEEHYVGFQLPFGENIRLKRTSDKIKQERSYRLYEKTKKRLGEFLPREVYSYSEFNEMSRDINEAAEDCMNKCQPIHRMHTFFKDLGDFRSAADNFLNNGQYNDARSILYDIDTLAANYMNIHPGFVATERNLINSIEKANIDLDSLSIYSSVKKRNVFLARRYYSRLGEDITKLERIEKQLVETYANIRNTSVDSLEVLLAEGKTSEESARLSLISNILSRLSQAQKEMHSYFIISEGSQKLTSLYPVEQLCQKEGTQIGSIELHNLQESEKMTNINTFILCNDSLNLWFPEGHLLSELDVGDTVDVPLKILPNSSFFCIDSVDHINALVKVTYTMNGIMYSDRVDSISVKIHDSRLIPIPSTNEYKHIPHFVDPEDSLVIRTKNFILQSINNLCNIYEIPEGHDMISEDAIVLSMAVMNFMADNMPGISSEADVKQGEIHTRFSDFRNILLEGSRTSYEKAVFTASVLMSMDIPCSIACYKDRWLILLEEDKTKSPFFSEIVATIDTTAYIPIAMRTQRDRFLEAVFCGKRLAYEYKSEKEEMAQLSRFKADIHDLTRDQLLISSSKIDSSLKLVEKPYRGGMREKHNPYLTEDEEMEIRLKLAYVFGVTNRDPEMREQFVHLLCLDGSRDWLGDSGMIRSNARREWEDAKSSYQTRCAQSMKEDINRSFLVMQLPVEGNIISSCKRYKKPVFFNLNLPALYKEYTDLKELKESRELL